MSKTEAHDEVTVQFLEEFLAAWNRHDIEGILELLDADCLYITGDGAREDAMRSGSCSPDS